MRVLAFLTSALLIGVASVGPPARGQEAPPSRAGKQPSKYTKSDVERVVARLAHDVEVFRAGARRDIDPKEVDDLPAEQRLEPATRDVAKAIDRLRTRVDGADDWWKALPEVKNALRVSQGVNELIANVYAYTPARRRWLAARKQVNELARIYELPELPVPAEPPEPPKPEPDTAKGTKPPQVRR